MKFSKTGFLILLGTLVTSFSSVSLAQEEKPFPLIPYPTSLIKVKGNFTIRAATPLVIAPDAEIFRNEANVLQDMLSAGLGKKLNETQTAPVSGFIQLKFKSSISTEEGYRLEIAPSKIIICAGKPAGMFRGIETLRQLLPVSVENGNIRVTQFQLPAGVFQTSRLIPGAACTLMLPGTFLRLNI